MTKFNLSQIKFIKQSEKDHFNTLSNIELVKLENRYLDKGDFMRASYISRLLIVRNHESECHVLPAIVDEAAYV